MGLASPGRRVPLVDAFQRAAGRAALTPASLHLNTQCDSTLGLVGSGTAAPGRRPGRPGRQAASVAVHSWGDFSHQSVISEFP